MRRESVQAAVLEAEMFLDRARHLLADEPEERYSFFGSKASGALRRQSLELTRALAAMRKP